ncbi:hypothetical protein JXJ21_21885 [candidate division KSB1 bacterium]|nr:hypothetical protein [candidate division KSB1 bacterium]
MKQIISTVAAGICFSQTLYALDHEIMFHHITTVDGLSSDVVYDILQDSRGFMWFGTQDGLCRYDGYSFKEFKYDPYDSNSISSNWASRLFEDRAGNIWIGTVRGGVNRFDPATETFTRFSHDPGDSNTIGDNTAFGISQDSSGTIWIGTWRGLDRLILNNDRKATEIAHFKADSTNPNQLSYDSIWNLYTDSEHHLWIATSDGGLNEFDIAAERFAHFKRNSADPHSISSNRIRNIYEDPAGEGKILWIGTYGGINRFDKRTRQFISFQHVPNQPGSLSHNLAIPICRDKKGTLWIGTAGGLNRLLETRQGGESLGAFQHYRHDAADPKSLSHDFIFDICEDRSGVIWLATIGGGVNKIVSEKKQFAINEFCRNVKAIYQDSAGVMWLGSSRGILRYNPADDSFIQFAHDPENRNSLIHNNVTAICEDHFSAARTLWIACYGGGLDLLVFDATGSSAQFSHFLHDPDDPHSLNSDCADKVFIDHSGTLWVGTCEGLNQFDRVTETFTRYEHKPADPTSISGKWVTAIFQAPGNDSILWVGTDNGLNKFFLKEKRFKRYNHNPADQNSPGHKYIQSICADANGDGKILWLGTFGGGLDKFDTETERFTHFTEKHQLANTTIYSILQADDGALWLTTKDGISKFDPKTVFFRNYSKGDGVVGIPFHRSSCFKSPDGKLLFGCNGGYISFFPDSIKDNPHVPQIVLTDFRIFNNPVALGTAIHALREIKLSHDQNFFSFEFAALDYTNPAKNQYAYMLEGIDPDWIYCGNRRYVSYANLKGGEYVFRIKGSNNDGVWNQEGAELKIIITPPLWETTLFRVVIGMMLFGIFAGIYKFRVSILKKDKQVQQTFSKRLIEEVEKGRKRIAGELHDSLGQNLLIIKNELDQLRDSPSTENAYREEIDELSELAAQSINEVRQISYNLHPHLLDRLGLKKAIESMVERCTQSSKIQFDAQIGDVDRLFPEETQINFYRIVQEAINNIIKHSDASEACVRITGSNRAVRILINDNGKGFDPGVSLSSHSGHRGFGLYGIAERTRILNGKFDINSKPGHGTKITISIPRSVTPMKAE